MALYEAIEKGKAQKPPHLRAGARGKMCGTCRYFKATSTSRGACRLYAGYPVAASQVCDSYRGD